MLKFYVSIQPALHIHDNEKGASEKKLTPCRYTKADNDFLPSIKHL